MEVIANYKCVTGEGPIWHSQEKKLYWLDIPSGFIFRYDPFTNKHEQIYKGSQIGGITIQSDGNLLLFMEKGAIAIWDGNELNYVIETLEGEETSRFNDVIAAPNGSVFCGTMSTTENLGTLYRLDPDGSIQPVITGIGISNGLGFTTDCEWMYYTDSTAHTIYKYRINPINGELSERSVFITTPINEGIPDGMTVDSEDHVWSARWDGWALYRYSPDGEQVNKIDFNTKKVSCPTFAENPLNKERPENSYTDMYVTTAGGDNPSENGLQAGALFRLNPGISGKPEFRSQIFL